MTQQDVDRAAALRTLADSHYSGLLAPGTHPSISPRAQEQILIEGNRQGIHPSKAPALLAFEYAYRWNEEHKPTANPPAYRVEIVYGPFQKPTEQWKAEPCFKE